MLILLCMLACVADDWNGEPYLGPGSTTVVDTGGVPATDGLQGNWISQGADIAPLLAGEPFNYVRVEASFREDGSYTVTSEDSNGDSWPLTGTWSALEGTPGTVTLSQAEPYEATAEGIWQVDGATLTYEVVQTSPDYGFLPPTPSSGFGTTTGPGLEPGINVQIYQVAP